MSSEEWKPVPGFEGWYDVSSQGRVRSWYNHKYGRSETPKILKGGINRYGYPYVLMKSDSGKVNRTVHSLVMLAFVGPRPTDLEVCHGNGIRSDNRLENLRYDTRSENAKEKFRHRRSPNPTNP